MDAVWHSLTVKGALLMKALVVVAILAVASACTSSPISASTLGSADSPTSSAQVNPEGPIEAPRSAALMESKRLVGLANVPPEARPQSSAPLPSLEQPPEAPSSRYLLDTAVWWSLPSTASNLLSWLRNHPPEGLRAAGEGSGTTVTGPVWYLRYGDEAAPAYSAATLFVEVAPHGSSRSAVRVGGQTMWLPPRPAREYVPSDVSRVGLLAYRLAGAGDARQILARRTVTGSEATRFVRLANDLPRDNRGSVNCAFDTGLRLRATFVSPDRHWLVFTYTPACGSVSVTSNGRSLPGLVITPLFYRAITSALPRLNA
jgi:hypothetical protein